jgi:hypothetical protein
MLSPTLELFEAICEELRLKDACIVTNDFLSPDRLQELQDEFEEFDPNRAFTKAMKSLQKHFRNRGAELPFTFNLVTRRFEIRDRPYVNFLTSVVSFRGKGRRSREFEVAACEQLQVRATGDLYRVGWPRKNRKKGADFNAYLRRLGFDGRIILGKEKDGGLDILWMPPLGVPPHRLLVSIQCKNSSYDVESADKSYGAAVRSLGCHVGLQPQVHVSCVLFNDYIDRKVLGKKPFNYLVMGLSDLAALTQRIRIDVL